MLSMEIVRAAGSRGRSEGEEQETSGGAGEAVRHAARRVLVVEDNLDTLRTTTALLRDMGHEVDYAINGYAALEAARRFKPQVIILDLGLPGMDGFELCRKLKSEPAARSVRIIALTGYGQDEYRQRSREAGCELHLLKPVDPSVLQHIIEQGP